MRHFLILVWLMAALFVGLQRTGQGANSGLTPIYLPLAVHLWAAQPDTLDPVSVTTGGDGPSYAPQTSADGSAVVFLSEAANLVAGDSNAVADAFLWKQPTHQFQRLSVATSGAQADAATTGAWLSGDGRYALFVSAASNLVPGDINGSPDLFRRDLLNGRTDLVSVDASGSPGGRVAHAGLSANGNIVYFTSEAAMTAGQMPPACGLPPCTVLYRRDMSLGTTAVAATAPDGSPATPIRDLFVTDDGEMVIYAQIQDAGQICDEYGCSPRHGQFIWRRPAGAGSATLVARSNVWSYAHAYNETYVSLRGASRDGSTVAFTDDTEGGSSTGGGSSYSLRVRIGEAEPVWLYGSAYYYPNREERGPLGAGDFSASANGEVMLFTAADLNSENSSPQFPEDTNGYIDLFRRTGWETARFVNAITGSLAHPSLSSDARIVYFEAVPLGETDPSQSDIYVAWLQ